MFSPFEVTLMELGKEGEEIKRSQAEINVRTQIFNQKLTGFLKEQGLPDDFTLPEMALLAIRKSRG